VSAICELDLGATGPITAEKPSGIAETVSKYISGDRPETDINQENNPKPTYHISTSPNPHFHTSKL